jgi:hypothetical protein
MRRVVYVSHNSAENKLDDINYHLDKNFNIFDRIFDNNFNKNYSTEFDNKDKPEIKRNSNSHRKKILLRKKTKSKLF